MVPTPTVESWINSQTPAGLGTFGQLKNRTYSQSFAANSATYTLTSQVTI